MLLEILIPNQVDHEAYELPAAQLTLLFGAVAGRSMEPACNSLCEACNQRRKARLAMRPRADRPCQAVE
jgi:hypothetical protein